MFYVKSCHQTTYRVPLYEMPWLPVMVLLVFGVVSIAYMIQMPEENDISPQLLRRSVEPEVELVETEPEHVVEPVDTKGHSNIVKPEIEPEPVKAVQDPDNIKQNDTVSMAGETDTTFLSYKRKLWNGCKPFKKKKSIQEELYMQLVNVVKSLNNANITYALYAGSLIGVLRDNNINPFEVDNDLMISENFFLTEDIRYIFFKNGLHIFKDGIYRACNIGKKSSTAPWSGDYTTYSDFYSFLPYIHCNTIDVFSKMDRRRIDHYESVKLLNLSVNIPNKKLSQDCLNTRYGNWKKYSGGQYWKVKVHRDYDN